MSLVLGGSVEKGPRCTLTGDAGPDSKGSDIWAL